MEDYRFSDYKPADRPPGKPQEDSSELPRGVQRLMRYGMLYFDPEQGFQPTSLFTIALAVLSVLDSLLELGFSVLLGALLGWFATLLGLHTLMPVDIQSMPLWRLGAMAAFLGHAVRSYVRPSILGRSLVTALNNAAAK